MKSAHTPVLVTVSLGQRLNDSLAPPYVCEACARHIVSNSFSVSMSNRM